MTKDTCCGTCRELGLTGECPFTWEIRKPVHPSCSHYTFDLVKGVQVAIDGVMTSLIPLMKAFDSLYEGLKHD